MTDESRFKVLFNKDVVKVCVRKGFPLKFEPLVLQSSAEKDPTPADYPPGGAPEDLSPPFWRCTTIMDHQGCGAVWLKERRVACPCGGYVARVESAPELWKI